MTSRISIKSACALALIWPAAAGAAAEPSILTRYQNAAEIQLARTHHWLLNAKITPHWVVGQNLFWYEQETDKGHRFVVVDAASGAKSDGFDQARLATELGKAVGQKIDADDLPIKAVSLDPIAQSVRFNAFHKAWLFDRAGLREMGEPRAQFSISPDRKLGVFFKDNDLWVRDFASKEEKRLTTDGEEHYRYGTTPEASLVPLVSPQVVWSPDSTRIFTAQTDDRKVLDLPVIDFAPKDGKRPEVVHNRAALPGDVNVPMFRLTIIDVRDGRQTPVHYASIPAVRMNDSPMAGNRMWWAANGKTAYFVDVERGEKIAHVEAVNADTGAVRELFSETSDTSLELSSDVYGPATIAPLPASNRLIWYSERSGWAHFYLYDLTTGKLIRPLTQGNWLVRELLGVDEARHQAYFSLAGRTPNKNLYYQEVARVDINTGKMTVLSSSDDDHEVAVADDSAALNYLSQGGDPAGVQGLAPSGDYFVETVARADRPSRTDVRARDGRLVATIENPDASRFPAFWHWPKVVKTIAADGKTEINGLVFRPSSYDPHGKYPVIDYIYGGPQVAYVPKAFDQSAYKDAASLAELGFVVTMFDGRGTTQRSRAFHVESYGKAETASNLEDHIAGIKQLAAADPAIDVSRVGITGFSAGGYMTAIAMFRYPEFFKVGVAGSGNYDQRLFWATWGERYEGYPVGDHYKQQAASTYVKGLTGKLLLVHGLLDRGVHPGNVFQLEQALQDANKDYDTLLWPTLPHDISAYGKRRIWDYFVQNLAGETPPHEFKLKTDRDVERVKSRAAEIKPDSDKGASDTGAATGGVSSAAISTSAEAK